MGERILLLSEYGFMITPSLNPSREAHNAVLSRFLELFDALIGLNKKQGQIPIPENMISGYEVLVVCHMEKNYYFSRPIVQYKARMGTQQRDDDL